MTLTAQAVQGYAAEAAALIARYDDIPSDSLYADVCDLLPDVPCRVLDVGCGNGRDAAWCNAFGHRVTAVDPVPAFVAETARRVPGATVTLCALPGLVAVAGPFDLILVSGVWQHVDPVDRPAAMARLADILGDGGRIVLSLRHGTAPATRPVAPIDAEATVALAQACGLGVVRKISAGSRQPQNIAAGVCWTWLVLEKGRAR